MRANPRELVDDTRGAILLTGLFMACFLIGCLWFVVGIGDTLVFREKMQEASDHAAFTSAALNAKGMNFLSLCNLVLLAAIAIHLILGIIHDIALALCIVTLGFSCGFWATMRQFYTGYFRVLKPAAKAIAIAEKTAAYGFPVMGMVEGYRLGKKYGTPGHEPMVIPLSTSLIPGGLIRAAGVRTVMKEGLPVQQVGMNFICRKISNLGITTIFNRALGIGGGFAGVVVSFAKSIIGTVIELRYCNDLGTAAGRLSQGGFGDRLGDGNGAIDRENRRTGGTRPPVDVGGGGGDSGGGGGSSGGGGGGGGIDPGFDPFWATPGPMVVWAPASNGNEWFQTYAFNFGPELDDTSESKVGIARGTKTGLAKYTKTEKPMGYFAQAEFYFDCDKKWGDLDCNFENNASFQIKWRARLRRLQIPNVANMLGTMGVDMLINIPKYQEFKSLEWVLGRDGGRVFGGGIVGASAIRIFTGYFIGRAEGMVRGATTDVTKGLAPTLVGAYH